MTSEQRRMAARRRQRQGRTNLYVLLVAGVLVLAGVLAVWYFGGSKGSTEDSFAQQASPPDDGSLADVIWPTYVSRGSGAVKEAYQFAVARPDVLSYMPCYCGCSGEGHRSNRDCFIGNYNQGGKTITFDSHGAT